MDGVAGLAAIDLDGRMLVYKRALFVGVAFEADGIMARRGTNLLRSHRSVYVMAIAALNQSFVDAVVERHLELRLLLRMASVAQLGLRLDQ